jgi:hypothetical protein
MADTETMDRLFLELSQFTAAKTAKELRLEKELGRAYRALGGIYACVVRSEPPPLAYHCMAIGAAIRFIDEESLDGSDYFEGKSVDVLHEVLNRRKPRP